MTRPKPKLRGILNSDEAWVAMQMGHIVADQTTGLKYKLDNEKLVVLSPFGTWEPNIKPIEWFMITLFRVSDDK